jgi:hypothetical protein
VRVTRGFSVLALIGAFLIKTGFVLAFVGFLALEAKSFYWRLSFLPDLVAAAWPHWPTTGSYLTGAFWLLLVPFYVTALCRSWSSH